MMKTIIVDPFPREMDLIFRANKIKLLKKNFKIIIKKGQMKI